MREKKSSKKKAKNKSARLAEQCAQNEIALIDKKVERLISYSDQKKKTEIEDLSDIKKLKNTLLSYLNEIKDKSLDSNAYEVIMKIKWLLGETLIRISVIYKKIIYAEQSVDSEYYAMAYNLLQQALVYACEIGTTDLIYSASLEISTLHMLKISFFETDDFGKDKQEDQKKWQQYETTYFSFMSNIDLVIELQKQPNAIMRKHVENFGFKLLEFAKYYELIPDLLGVEAFLTNCEITGELFSARYMDVISKGRAITMVISDEDYNIEPKIATINVVNIIRENYRVMVHSDQTKAEGLSQILIDANSRLVKLLKGDIEKLTGNDRLVYKACTLKTIARGHVMLAKNYNANSDPKLASLNFNLAKRYLQRYKNEVTTSYRSLQQDKRRNERLTGYEAYRQNHSNLKDYERNKLTLVKREADNVKYYLLESEIALGLGNYADLQTNLVKAIIAFSRYRRMSPDGRFFSKDAEAYISLSVDIERLPLRVSDLMDAVFSLDKNKVVLDNINRIKSNMDLLAAVSQNITEFQDRNAIEIIYAKLSIYYRDNCFFSKSKHCIDMLKKYSVTITPEAYDELIKLISSAENEYKLAKVKRPAKARKKPKKKKYSKAIEKAHAETSYCEALEEEVYNPVDTVAEAKPIPIFQQRLNAALVSLSKKNYSQCEAELNSAKELICDEGILAEITLQHYMADNYRCMAIANKKVEAYPLVVNNYELALEAFKKSLELCFKAQCSKDLSEDDLQQIRQIIQANDLSIDITTSDLQKVKQQMEQRYQEYLEFREYMLTNYPQRWKKNKNIDEMSNKSLIAFGCKAGLESIDELIHRSDNLRWAAWCLASDDFDGDYHEYFSSAGIVLEQCELLDEKNIPDEANAETQQQSILQIFARLHGLTRDLYTDDPQKIYIDLTMFAEHAIAEEQQHLLLLCDLALSDLELGYAKQCKTMHALDQMRLHLNYGLYLNQSGLSLLQELPDTEIYSLLGKHAKQRNNLFYNELSELSCKVMLPQSSALIARSNHKRSHSWSYGNSRCEAEKQSTELEQLTGMSQSL